MLGKRTLAAVLAAGTVFTISPVIAGAGEERSLNRIYADAWRDARTVAYVAPSASELAAMEKLFSRLLKGEPASAVLADLRALGWEALSVREGGTTWTVVAEAADQRKGRGLYAFSGSGRHAMQAPHVPSDELTGRILLRYADDGLPRALAWNTVPRTTANLAQLDGSYLIAFSRAFARAYPSEKIVQLHGFDFLRRRSIAAARSGAIVSAAHRFPPIELTSAVRCMQQKFENDTRLYGVDVRELGGTKNSVARALRKEAYEGFIHVELDLPLRKQLAAMPARRKALHACLGGNP